MKNNFLSFLGAVSFFTRIPIAKRINIPVDNYRDIIKFWPLTGIITGFIMATSFLLLNSVFPLTITIIGSLVVRIFITGALHEDGFCDFFDGFGGHHSKETILRIMKDSHIGTYGVVAILFYYLLTINLLINTPKSIIPYIFFTADPLSKFSSVLLMQFLPYARTEAESKSKMIFNKLSLISIIGAILCAFVPLYFLPLSLLSTIILIIPPLISTLIVGKISKTKIGGYTGDICGANVLIAEISIFTTYYLLINIPIK